MTTPLTAIAVIGGTFDPVHQGHIELITHIIDNYHFDEIQLIPNAIPPHKTAFATAEQRLAMLEIATKQYPQVAINTIEIQASQPSYSINTFKILKDNNPHAAIAMVVGLDSFNTMHQWQHIEALRALVNVIVINREGITLSSAPWQQQWLKEKQSDNIETLSQQTSDTLIIDAFTPSNVSASSLRTALKDNPNNCPNGIHPHVFDYIKNQKLYSKND